MGKLNQGILGKVYGKVGNTVSAKWKNLNTIRGYQPIVHNPKTEGQVTQRKKFTTIVHLVKQVLPTINEAYNGELSTMSPFNKVTSVNLKNAFTGAPPVLDHTLVSFCTHEGSTVSNATLTGLTNQEMYLTWDANTLIQEELDYMMTIILVSTTTNRVSTFEDTVKRVQGNVSLTVPPSWVGEEVAAHFVTSDYSEFSAPKRVIKFKAGADLAGKVK